MSVAVSRATAALAWLVGLMFGLPCGYAIKYFAQYGLVWTFMSFPTYGGGPFEDAGIPTTVPLLAAFLAVCTAELAMGWLFCRRRRSGLALALRLLPFDLAFWFGFLLPLGFVFGAVRTALVILLVVTAHGGNQATGPQCDSAASLTTQLRWPAPAR
jgi:hypothetical protein